MCGVFGLIGKNSSSVSGDVFRLLRHRGPDDYGLLCWDGEKPPTRGKRVSCAASLVYLAHTRLSILDLSKAGWQPMGTPDGRYYIVYNGEVYNYRELRAELEKAGVRFRSHTDTEVVLRAYALWGPEALNRFVGMFALAILDTKRRAVFLARDFFGIKPLYYTHLPDGGLAFASEIKALLALPGVKARAHPQRLYDYLRYGLTDHAPETLFQGIYHLPPAHYMVVPVDEPRRAEPVRYWDPTPTETLDISFEEATSRLREMFLESVRLHLRSDVSLGSALSGGIDSSAIVCAIRHLDPGAEIHTFSFIAEDAPEINEERWVDLVGRHVRARVHKVRPRPEEIVEDLDDLIYAQDEPFGSTSIYAQYRVFRLAREHGIKVMLDGQGADELLAGYPTYYAARFLSLLRQGKWGAALYFLRHASKHPASQGIWAILKRTVAHLLPDSLQSPLRRMAGEEVLPAWMNGEWFAERGVRPRPLWKSRSREALKEQLLLTFAQINLPSLLRYEDRNSMWHSIESRVPFLTPQVVQFVFSLPEGYILSLQGVTKAVFREAIKGLVPDSILNRRDKIGFRTPEARWLTALRPWVEDLLRSEATRAIPVLCLEAARKEWKAMLEEKRRYDSRFWRWVNLIRWTERFEVEYE
ncbi:asparagine synthase (glutamine-hydrolyzing) [Thermosulfurimonas sp. F29]|uniref:asparagine synthase (glutamine-hydrolyzing) n=1 Tax=Thermosulfurimonas sp. F29 TaxID=2867247 RepID=UPI001C83F129|nr:asparagine synthase (glutamine-hydrolyzing) [Thermosulfurimonas sp. F29]MBX6423456.1 asparagine synthase (glutamine-hydrolyzing) [Thermosulfurimonas sp. F29]